MTDANNLFSIASLATQIPAAKLEKIESIVMMEAVKLRIRNQR
jgi:hypothetical protein